MRASYYAKALLSLVAERPEKSDEFVRRTVTLMRERGHAHLAHAMFRSFARLSRRAEEKGTIVVTTAREIGESEVAALLKRKPFSKLLTGHHRRVVRRVDDSVIGGASVSTSSMRIDGTHKRALTELYQEITDN